MRDSSWQPPGEFLRIATIDLHTGGEPLRVIRSGLPPLEGNTVL
jgi:trans-L-3-hydroxyproline dehydratase